MSAESNVILITNDTGVVNILKPKLVLLREIDNILTAPFSDALKTVKKYLPEVVLLFCSGESEQEECINIIKSIKSDSSIKNTSVLLVIKDFNQDFILNAYDENVTDFLALDSDDAEVLMRTIWGFKKNTLMKDIEKQHNLLEKMGVINSLTGFYTHDFSEKIFENEFVNLKKSKSDAAFLLLSAAEENKIDLTTEVFAQAIKNSTRNSDVVVHALSNRFYVLLPETNLKGMFRVLEKIKQNLGEGFKINAGVSFVGDKPFEQVQKELLNALTEAVSTNQEVVIVTEEEKHSSVDWLDKINSTQKNFKLFKQAFAKKLDKVIAPVFFQMQKLYEEKLYNTQIEQYSNSTLSVFILKKGKNVSELKITYPGFSKINVDLIHQGLDSPENRRINLDLTELDEVRLTQILEEFIQEFKVSASA